MKTIDHTLDKIFKLVFCLRRRQLEKRIRVNTWDKELSSRLDALQILIDDE